MKVEIWSDLVCPFCYIGKRRFEAGLQAFAHADTVEVVWRSFELDPNARPEPGRSVHESLAEKKGISVAQAKQMGAHVTQMAAELGLRYDFDRAIPTNTFLGHQLVHFAAHHGRQDAMKERLMAAYYTEGQNLNDLATLTSLAAEIGLDAEAARQALEAGTYANEVRLDEYQAQQINVRGVPYFVFEDKYAVSGAQPIELFTEVLQTVWNEAHPAPTVLATGEACDVDGQNC
ncbi:DsbA family oxidoreductase [Hymenobacter sp. ASUV-10]|uniref:DsbA family oxidoreductase n=1 Tax=Hymenobacter aranciens TaxID=3063996 RepID=A0ABT9BD19_9BACT|nr:DsbA family oxidoreductase [Hymenobacter sp. ASUV-10]MDO7874932.1 DsbA family oxidoreductase [Hymenobacter sp. ASUV-10]